MVETKIRCKVNLKVGLTFIVIGVLLLLVGSRILSIFRDGEENIGRVDTDEAVTECRSMPALNFCGRVSIFGGVMVIIVKALGTDFGLGKDNL